MSWLIAHLVGDFILQNDWMAEGKKRSSWICAAHVAAYMLPFLLIGLTWWQLALIALQHWLQDRWTFIPWYMQACGKQVFAEPPLAPWSHIVLDNIFHLAWIALVIWAGNHLPDLA